MSHVHRIAWCEVRPFAGPVSRHSNRAAHGGVCELHTCRCGATRRVNVNRRHIERGEWQEPSQPAARLYLVRQEPAAQ